MRYTWLVDHLLNTGKIDDIDAKILNNLILNGREAIRSIAEDTEVSRPTVYDRIRKLERMGIIAHFTTQINYNAAGLPLTAFILVAFNPNEAKDQKDVASQISALDYIKRVNIITGNFDFLVEIAIDHMSNLADVIIDKIRAIDGVGNTVSNVSFKSYQGGHEINLPLSQYDTD